MLCPDCHRPMTTLFFSCVCDFCEGVLDEAEFDVGFVVWRGRSLPAQEYVFPTVEHAELYRRETGQADRPIVEVRAPVKFLWRQSTGSLTGLITANSLVTIYPDHRFPPQANRAYPSLPPPAP